MSDRKYLGGHQVLHHPYSHYTAQDWMFRYIEFYGAIDGEHHKTWVMDQVARIHHGTRVIVYKHEWDGGTVEYRFETGEPTKEYDEWVLSIMEWDEETQSYNYSYDIGTAP